jgi:catechol 2,3-dioxygenase-like lactoylglutathione lyase family enzyme
MKIKGITWLGTRTDNWDETVAVMRDVLGLKQVKLQPDVAVFDCANGDRVEIFSPKDTEHRYFRGVVGGFEVDDLEKAVEELRAAKIRIVGEVQRMSGFAWIHFYGPDGNVWELTARE